MKKIWPILVMARTLDHAGKIHKIHQQEEGAGDAESALMRAVLSQKNPYLWLGCEIIGLTLLGQKIIRIFEWSPEKGYHFL